MEPGGRRVALLGALALAAVSLVGLTTWAVRAMRFRENQINDWIAVHRVASQVELLRSRTGALPTQDELERFIAMSDLTDAWGNRLVYAAFASDGHNHYVVAALGRDGQVDHPWQDWIGRKRESIKGQWDRDTVVIDGSPHASGGK